MIGVVPVRMDGGDCSEVRLWAVLGLAMARMLRMDGKTNRKRELVKVKCIPVKQNAW